MTEYVFRPSRSGIKSRLYSGRYSLNRGEPIRTVALGTPDKATARAKLRKIIVEAQREAAGILTPRPQREAAAASLTALLGDMLADMRARGVTPKHVRDTEFRIRAILNGTGWKRLADIRADQFVKWRAGQTLAAKTQREYQAAFNNLLNWLVRLDRLAVNPLAKIRPVSVRGKQVRIARAFTTPELAALFAAAPSRQLVYQTLTYTGQRRAEVRALVVSDLHLAGDKPHALFRAETMKDRDKRPMPLHPCLAAELRRHVEGKRADAPVFVTMPDRKTLLRDMEAAGIPRKDSTGRVLHFHSFRKTFQTLGVMHGINQRAAQEMLGHSDANLTAKVYTDVPALELHGEVVKLPWIGAGEDATAIHSLSGDFARSESRFRTLCLELLSFSQAITAEDLARLQTSQKWRARRDSNPRPSA